MRTWQWWGRCLLVSGASSVTVAVAQTSSPTWGGYAAVSAEAWSNGTPVLDLSGHWAKGYQRRDGEQRAYVEGRAEVGVAVPWFQQPDGRAWRVGALARVDGSARLSGQAAQALYHYQSHTDPTQSVTLDAQSDILYWVGRGVAVHAPLLDQAGFKLDVSLDHMSLSRLRALDSAGHVSYDLASDTYGYAGTLRDDYSQKRALFIRPPETQGAGDAVSFQLSWQSPREDAHGWSVSSAWPDRWQLTVQDAWSRLTWRGINGDDAKLQSQVAELGDARITGQYTRRTVVERIPIAATVQATWTHPEGLWTVQLKNRVGLWQRWLSWQNPGEWGWRVAVEPLAGAYQFGVVWKGLSAQLMTDRLDNGAHARGGQVSLTSSF